MENLYLTDLNSTQIDKLVTGLGAPAYRAKQLRHWLYQGLVSSFEEMTNLPQNFRQALAEKTVLFKLNPIHEVTSRDGTVKVLFSLPDSKTVESALMPYPAPGGKTDYTICLSTQVGCPIGCPFCATGQQGFERNLTPGEITEQVLYFARHLHEAEPQDRITNLVFMGMGEPLANYDNLWQSVETLNSPDGFGLGARNMTISTAGLVPQIKRLSQEKLQIGLAVSLHASTDKVRNWLVPLNNKFPLEQLIPACRDYVNKTGRRITFEYILLEGINDSPVQAHQLVHLVAGLNCHVNLITANKTLGDLRPANQATITSFAEELKRLRVQCTVRQSRGIDIDAGCGQLRSRYAGSHPTTR
ncbi:MAG: 23S rRNA (adenine(2503)-C(2))-methyltransferase RlmN [Dehalococcoidales bacterium]|nr:23S rRNA (adenine(2503)-C(2))-methyltransferase RlmN [Dehalococcoidales bacterium]